MVAALRSIADYLWPYVRLLRIPSSEISLLAAFPSCAAVAMVTPFGREALFYIIICTIGAFCVRSAGCVVNDIFDRHFDSRVERTKLRPLAAGELSVAEALCALFLLLYMALNLLAYMNPLALSLCAMCGLSVVSYPLMKRFFAYPQFVLGIAFNGGVLIGPAMAANKLTMSVVLVYIGCIFWTTAYDTVYAHQDRRDDEILGLRSTAIEFGDRSGLYVGALYSAVCVFWVCAGVVAGIGYLYYVCMLACAGIFYCQCRAFDFDNPRKCMRMFKGNIYVGMLLFFGVCLGMWT